MEDQNTGMIDWRPPFAPIGVEDSTEAPTLPSVPPDPVAFVRDTLGWVPDPKQEAILRSQAKRIILCMGRRCGKTFVTAAKAVYFALSRPASQTLIFSRTIRQANLVLTNVRDFLRAAGLPIRGDGANPHSARLPNGAVILSLPSREANIRGFTPNLIIMDEAARIPDDVYHAITPMLGLHNPTLILLSSPWGTRGFFYEEWISSDPWDRYFAPTPECPRYDRAHLESERRRKPESVYRREYLCEFLEAGGVCFPDRLIERAIVDDPFTSQPRLARPRQYFIGVDLGRQQDHSAIAIIERLEIVSDVRDPFTMNLVMNRECRLIYLERLPLETPYPDVVRHICSLTRQYPQSELVVDATGVGLPVVDMFRAARPDARLQPVMITGGSVANSSSDVHRIPKRDLISRVQLMLESNDLKISNRLPALEHLREELRQFRMTINHSQHDQYSAREGEHDDLILALSLAAYKIR